MTEYKTIKDLPSEEKPYEKFETRGAEALTDAELLAVLLRSGTRGSSSLDLARLLLSPEISGGGLLNLYHMSTRELMKLPGIGRVKAIQLKCLLELSRRIAKEPFRKELSFDSPKSIADYYMEQMRHEEVEKVLLLLLDTKLHLMEEYLLSKGTVNASLLSTREVFRHALRAGACKIVLLHNHPSGSCNPSMEDLSVTKKIMEAGNLMEIPLLDHLIVGDGCYLSLKEYGYI